MPQKARQREEETESGRERGKSGENRNIKRLQCAPVSLGSTGYDGSGVNNVNIIAYSMYY